MNSFYIIVITLFFSQMGYSSDLGVNCEVKVATLQNGNKHVTSNKFTEPIHHGAGVVRFGREFFLVYDLMAYVYFIYDPEIGELDFSLRENASGSRFDSKMYLKSSQVASVKDNKVGKDINSTIESIEVTCNI